MSADGSAASFRANRRSNDSIEKVLDVGEGARVV